MTFNERITSIRKDELNWSVKQAVEEINKQLPSDSGISLKTLYSWEYGTTEPKFSYGIALCKAYGVSDVISLFATSHVALPTLNSEGKKRLAEYRQLLLGSEKFTHTQNKGNELLFKRLLPLYDIAASAGTGQVLDSAAYTSVEVPDSVPLSANFGIRIAGDSMEPAIHDGDTVWVHQQQTLENGEIGVFYLNGDVLCKQLSKSENGTFLVSLNAVYKPITLTDDSDLRVFGKVVG